MARVRQKDRKYQTLIPFGPNAWTILGRAVVAVFPYPTVPTPPPPPHAFCVTFLNTKKKHFHVAQAHSSWSFIPGLNSQQT